MIINIAHSLRSKAEELSTKTGLVEAKTGLEYSFAELEKKSDQYAWKLTDKGILPGARVMLMVKPSADFICLAFALFKVGATVILIDPGMGYKNLLTCISGVKPTVFIGIPKAHLFLSLFKKHFSSIKQKFCIGNSFAFFGKDFSKITHHNREEFPIYSPQPEDLAAIIFTTGSTGPPKGVRYEHDIFASQLHYIQTYYSISSSDIDQPAFPLFALFSTALGACAVIPDMDPTKPANVAPEKFISSIENNHVTYSFGSPALWRVISKYCHKKNIQLKTLRKVLMAGAPVPGSLLEDMYSILPDNAEIHTPYGATECLPIVSIEGKEVVSDTWERTQKGQGTCVGSPLPEIEVIIAAITCEESDNDDAIQILNCGEIGEIIVSGKVVTRSYDNNSLETKKAKLIYDNKLWHRMGDVGYLDDTGRIWFCGRKGHIVFTKDGPKYTIQCEAIINNHSDVYRSALVGIHERNKIKTPVMIVEKLKGCNRPDSELLDEIRQLCQNSNLTNDIMYFLIHPEFPVDIRHNAKIFREKLAVWAEEKIEKP